MEKKSLFDYMKPEEVQRMKKAYAERMSGNSNYKTAPVSPIVYMLAELGYYFGWQAIVDAKRGYTDGDIPLTMDEVSELTRAGRKIAYSQIINNARGTQVATGSVISKNPKEVFKKGMKQFLDEVKE
jgi:hypothetical protein